MNHKPAIRIENLSKTYKLYNSHRDRMKEWLHPLRKPYHTKHHALKDISLSVGRGEVLGVIGQNGSGKSTLLKILSSVVTPSSGSFNCTGRVSALLELGGGFNMDLTGVENTFFLGAIQGYSKNEMKERLKQILDFAEIGEYAHQPVKNYSSGMYVRLAFSISINIDPEILIVDEALAVGDIRYQQKCYRKIREIKDSGKTIVFCSHSLDAIQDFCTTAIWIHHGKIAAQGDPNIVSKKYQTFMAQNGSTAKQSTSEQSSAPKSLMPELLLKPEFRQLVWNDMRKYQTSGSGKAQITHATMIDLETGKSASSAKAGNTLRVACIVWTKEPLHQPGFQVLMHGRFGSEVFNINNYHYHQPLTILQNQPNVLAVDFKTPPLGNGNYSLSLAVSEIINGVATVLFQVNDAMILNIENPDIRYHTGTQMVVEEARVHTLQASQILNL